MELKINDNLMKDLINFLSNKFSKEELYYNNFKSCVEMTISDLDNKIEMLNDEDTEKAELEVQKLTPELFLFELIYDNIDLFEDLSIFKIEGDAILDIPASD